MDVKRYLREVIESIGRTDVKFAEVLYKWRGLIPRSIKKVAGIIGEPEEDVFHDFFLILHKANIYYNIEFYKYKDHLYEIKERDGSLVYIVSNPFNTRFTHKVWVPFSHIKWVEKSSLSSFIYHQICQYSFDRINLHCRSRNGYSVVSSKEKEIVVHRGGSRKKIKKIVNKLERVTVISTESLVGDKGNLTVKDTLQSFDPLQSDICEEKLMIERSGFSADAQCVLMNWLGNPGLSSNAVAADLGYSRHKARVAKAEIARQLLDINNTPRKNRYYFDGVEFKKIMERGDNFLLSLPSGKSIWAAKDDTVIYPNVVKPVQLTAGDVR